MREVCQDFLGDIGDFQKIADSFIVIFDAVSKEVETEKMKVRLKKSDYSFARDIFNQEVFLMTLKRDLQFTVCGRQLEPVTC